MSGSAPKRKRAALAAPLTAVIKPSAAPTIKYPNAQAFRDALRVDEPEAAKEGELNTFWNHSVRLALTDYHPALTVS